MGERAKEILLNRSRHNVIKLEAARITVTAIASKAFVTSIAGKTYSNVFPGHLGKIVSGQHRRIGKWFVELPDKLRQNLHSIRANDKLSMVCLTVLSH